MTEPHLILHRVRGLPAFDIAVLIGHDGDEREMWIIPTSGHRAYPYWRLSLEILTNTLDDNTHLMIEMERLGLPIPANIPESWPDHYACNNPSTKLTESGANLLDRLGLAQKVDRRF